MNNINILFDGMEIPIEHYECLKDLIYDDNQIIMKYGNKLLINFVGYIEIEYKKSEYRFFSFPKNYKVTNIKIDIKKIIETIESSFKRNNADTNGFYISQFNALNNIVNYYNEHGLYVNRQKKVIVKNSGKINFKKTIRKIKPIYISDYEYVYDKFVITKMHTNNTIITECMSYIIENGCKKYDFYFSAINTNYFVDQTIFKNIKFLISQLRKIRIDVFKDEDKKLVDSIIEYFENSSLSSTYISNLCTTNYELVYEQMVHYALVNVKNSKYIEKKFYINEEDKENKFVPDHFDEENKIIADSKYYKNEIKNDYKQLFYLQHIGNMYANSNNYKERVHEINQWLNFLIISHDEYSCKQIIKRRTIDGLNLFTLYININDVVDNYNNDSNQIISEITSAIKEMRKLNNEN